MPLEEKRRTNPVRVYPGRRATDYHVCAGDDEADLDKAVAEYIADGFEPLGGVAVVVHQENSKLRGTFVQLFQAMVKRGAN